MLLSKLREVTKEGNFHWALLFDGDIFTEGSRGFNPATVHALFGHPEFGHFDMVCGNQMVGDGMYRDVFGLRFKSLEENPIEPAGMAVGGKLWFSGKNLVSVASCFSGLAIYTRAALLDSACSYDFEGEDICEHVALHKCLAKEGHGRIALYPPMALRMWQARGETAFDPALHERSVSWEPNDPHPALVAEECAWVRIA
jgi:hypothetical protein